MNTDEIAAVTRGVSRAMTEKFAVTLESMRAEMAALRQEIKSLEERPVRDGIDGKDGRDGADGQKGMDGQSGRDGTDGKDGVSGRDGIDGKDGQPGLAGADGKNGADGANGRDGVDGKDGARGEDGKSLTVEDIRPMFETEAERKLLDLERRAVDLMQRTADRMPPGPAGKDGLDGTDGKDGLGFGDLQMEHDGERTVVLKAVRDDQVKEIGRAVFPVQIHRGVFDERKTYQKDDVVTWAGSSWIAKKDNPSGKPNSSPDWVLIVKKGGEGKQGIEGKTGPRGDQGPQGPMGGKW